LENLVKHTRIISGKCYIFRLKTNKVVSLRAFRNPAS